MQFVTLTGNSGTFTLTFDGQTTASIPFNASTAQVQTALQNLVTIGANNVVVDGAPNSYSIVLTGALVSLPLGSASTTITAAGSACPVVSIATSGGATVMVGQVYPTSFNAADQVAFVAGLADSNEITSAQTVTIASSGILNLQGQSNTIATLTMSGGQVLTDPAC